MRKALFILFLASTLSLLTISCNPNHSPTTSTYNDNFNAENLKSEVSITPTPTVATTNLTNFTSSIALTPIATIEALTNASNATARQVSLKGES